MVQRSDESEDEEEKAEEDVQAEQAKEMALTTWSKHEEPGVIKNKSFSC